MNKWLPRVPDPDREQARELGRIAVPALWPNKIADSTYPGKVALLEITKLVEKRVEEGLAIAADYKRRGMEEQATKCWAAAEALNELAKEIARRTGVL